MALYFHVRTHSAELPVIEVEVGGRSAHVEGEVEVEEVALAEEELVLVPAGNMNHVTMTTTGVRTRITGDDVILILNLWHQSNHFPQNTRLHLIYPPLILLHLISLHLIHHSLLPHSPLHP